MGPEVQLVSTAEAARLLRTIREEEVRWRDWRNECLMVIGETNGAPAGWLDLDWRLDQREYWLRDHARVAPGLDYGAHARPLLVAAVERAVRRRAARICVVDRGAPPGARRLYAEMEFRLPSEVVASSRPVAWSLELG